MLKIRSFFRTPDEYEWVVNLSNTVWSDRHTSLAEWKHFENSAPPNTLYREIVAELNGERVGHAFYCKPWWWSEKTGKFFFEMLVHPNYQQRGIDRALYQFLLSDLASEQPQVLLTQSREDQHHAKEFLKEMGFEQTMRYPRSQLDVGNFDENAYKALQLKLDDEGIRICTLTELQATDPQWKDKLYELRWDILKDVPSPEPREKPSFEQYERAFLNNPELLPDANFIATKDGKYLALSNYWPVEGQAKLNTGLTGVVRDHRRKGIATALKARGAAYAATHHIALIETENEENNPMYKLNLQLGFQPCPAYLDFRKVLSLHSTGFNSKQPNHTIEEPMT